MSVRRRTSHALLAVVAFLLGLAGPAAAGRTPKGKPPSVTTRGWKNGSSKGATTISRNRKGEIVSKMRIVQFRRGAKARRGESQLIVENRRGRTVDRSYKNAAGQEVFETGALDGSALRETLLSKTIKRIERIDPKGNVGRASYEVDTRTSVDAIVQVLGAEIARLGGRAISATRGGKSFGVNQWTTATSLRESWAILGIR
jgi:hypothetical protein